jgi:hypothetical protein
MIDFPLPDVGWIDAIVCFVLLCATYLRINTMNRSTTRACAVLLYILLGMGAMSVFLGPIYQDIEMRQVGHAFIDTALLGLMLINRRKVPSES